MTRVQCKCGQSFNVSNEELRKAGHTLPELDAAFQPPVMHVPVCRVCYVKRFMAALDNALDGCDKLRQEIRKAAKYPV